MNAIEHNRERARRSRLGGQLQRLCVDRSTARAKSVSLPHAQETDPQRAASVTSACSPAVAGRTCPGESGTENAASRSMSGASSGSSASSASSSRPGDEPRELSPSASASGWWLKRDSAVEPTSASVAYASSLGIASISRSSRPSPRLRRRAGRGCAQSRASSR